MHALMVFFAGAFCANACPHFLFGVAGAEFHTPFLYRFFKSVPSPLFNALWGLFNWSLTAWFLCGVSEFRPGYNPGSLVFASGFAFAAVCMAVYFRRRTLREAHASE